ncbi:MAG: UTP--glucose-1-phosphate uridylyltransferase [Clostridia bacterium]|nr:UTP--glucose-1-phosphate uridylyltransferase [Clostridia bacterium]
MNLKEAQALLKAYNQEHLLEYYDLLDDDKKQELLAAIADIDFSVLENLSFDKERSVGKLAPTDALALEEIDKRRGEYEKVGLEAVANGKVAAVLLAGGQGTRLGIDAPKGTFNIGVNKPLSIFECQMRNLIAVAKMAGAYPHLFIMTSTINNAQTVAFFKQNAYFGYEPDKVHFYVQKTAPAISTDGKILLEETHKPVLTPNGNGGWYSSLKEAECGKILDKENIEWLNVYGVDNVLQRICDPVFVGATILSGLACSSKVVRKASPEEKVGVLCKEDGLPAIVEYYEMPEKQKTEVDGSGRLVYCFGVILNYLFSVEKLNGIYKNKLPYHLANKKVACIVGGKKVVPEQPNGYKLETLTVDLVKLAGSCLGFEVEREREFAPVKNATGVDSVETARALLAKNGVEL